MSLALSLPEVANRRDPRVETRAVYVEEWVEELPFANPASLCTQLMLTVSRLNRNPVKPKARLRLMDHYADAYQSLLHLCEELRPAQSLSTQKKQRQTGKGAEQLAVEMAYGYKLVISELAEKRSVRKLLAVAVQRAMVFTSVVIMLEYDQYRPTYSTLWNELWTLYDLSRTQGFSDLAVRHAGLTDIFEQSPLRLFKRCVLTSMVDPYHLPEHLVWKIFHLFGDLVDAATLQMDTEGGKPGISVLTGQPAPSRVDGSKPSSTPIDNCPPFVLDARPLLEQVDALQSNQADADLEAGEVGALIESGLRLVRTRRLPREPASGTVEIAGGLSTVHHLLADSTPTISGDSNDKPGEDESPGWAAGQLLPIYRTDRWWLVDRNANGVRIRTPEMRTLINVGELVAMRTDEENDRAWSVGLIRWLRVVGDVEQHAGVEWMSHEPRPVSFYLEGGSASLGLGFFDKLSDNALKLLTSRARCHEGQVLDGMVDGRTVRLDIDARLERTDRYDLYRVENSL